MCTQEWWPLDQTTLDALARSTAPILIVNALEQPNAAVEVARAIHQAGPRRLGPFFRLSCEGLPGEVLQSELFGHDADPANGLFRRKPGLCEVAADGTLCLLSVDHAPRSIQAALCQMIDSAALRAAAGVGPVPVSVRLIAAISVSRRGAFNLSTLVSRELQARFTLVPLGGV